MTEISIKKGMCGEIYNIPEEKKFVNICGREYTCDKCSIPGVVAYGLSKIMAKDNLVEDRSQRIWQIGGLLNLDCNKLPGLKERKVAC
jgi:hypothetical protein